MNALGRPTDLGVDPASIGGVMPGQLRQVAYVVNDLASQVAGLVGLGVGPWFVIRNIQSRNVYRGAHVPVSFSVAFANAGDLQLEVIQPNDHGPSIFREFLDGGREGFHHLAWWSDDYDADVASAEAAGLKPAFRDDGLAAKYTYFDSPDLALATALEIVEITSANRGLFDRVRIAASQWNRRDHPVRHLPPALLGAGLSSGRNSRG